MVNTDDFIKRLEAILEYYSLSASLFADKVGVQRSGLSHLLSGRNKPSLDFVMKITESFPEVDLYWLLNGTGSFPKKEEGEDPAPEPSPAPIPVIAHTPTPELFPSPPAEKKEPVVTDLFSQAEEVPATKPEGKIEKMRTEKNIERIVMFYSDGTFKEYLPEN
jgi:transcriptional regulator with XRE-family HTH domain